MEPSSGIYSRGLPGDTLGNAWGMPWPLNGEAERDEDG